MASLKHELSVTLISWSPLTGEMPESGPLRRGVPEVGSDDRDECWW